MWGFVVLTAVSTHVSLAGVLDEQKERKVKEEGGGEEK